MLLDTAGRTALVGHGLQHVRARGERGHHAWQRGGRDAARAVVARVERVLHADQVPLGPAPVRPAARPRARAHAPGGPRAPRWSKQRARQTCSRQGRGMRLVHEEVGLPTLTKLPRLEHRRGMACLAAPRAVLRGNGERA